MTPIKLMADYQCWPLWHDGDDPERIGNIDPETLPISDDLKNALARWGQRLDDTLNWDDPANTVWPQNFWSDFNDEGRSLGSQLRHELGPAFTVREHFWGEDC